MPTATDTREQATRRKRKVLLYVVALLVAFIVGYLIPMRESFALRDDVERLSADLLVANETMQRNEVVEHASVAALYVATGDFDSAGRHTAQFFDGLE
ncbi:MAG: hypothetical protein HKN91_07970, partial [Acidimicrobiia bacterium]|nr:hypothetical protein [Acidimicrobiia bacterium]